MAGDRDFAVVIGGIYTGIFTPTEDAAVGAVGTGLLAWLNGDLHGNRLREPFEATASGTAMVFMIVIGAAAYNTFLALSQLPQETAGWVGTLGLSPYAILWAILMFYLVFGCVMDSLSMILLTIPIFFPMISGLDFGPTPEETAIRFGIPVLFPTIPLFVMRLLHDPTARHRPGLHEPQPRLRHTAARRGGRGAAAGGAGPGCHAFDTAALYGFGSNETLAGQVLAPHRDRFVLASKCRMQGVDGKRVIDGRPQTIQASVDASLQRLRTDRIDLLYLQRWDKTVPIEDSVGAMADLVRAGKLRQLGLSEVAARTLRKAHAVHPISAVQAEYSLWTREAKIAVLDTCREIGAAFVGFSPLARAYLTGTLRDPATLEPKDIRRGMPRFEAETYAKNLALLPAYEALAREAGCTPAQLALAWLLVRGEHIVPIPGTRSRVHLRKNLGAWDVTLKADQMARLDALINQRSVSGPRYNAATTAEIDTELF